MFDMNQPERPERITRQDVGSWLDGPPQLNQYDYPGQRLGRPRSGPGSIARWGRRIVALLIDWLIALALSALIFHADPWANLSIFVVLQLVMVSIFGRSIGHWMLGMQVQRMAGGPVNILDALVRTVLLVLVVPPFVQDPDQRGVHDRARGLVLVMVR